MKTNFKYILIASCATFFISCSNTTPTVNSMYSVTETYTIPTKKTVLGKTYTKSKNVYEVGVGTCYGASWNGRKTANDEIFNSKEMTAAHKTLPFDTYVRVTNLNNKKQVTVRINDRGPNAKYKDRVIDLSCGAFEQIAKVSEGLIPVEIELLPN